MTADRRLRVGGWAALLVAILAPLQIVAIWLDVASFTVMTSPDPWSSQPFLTLDVVRLTAVLIGVVGLDRLFASHDPRMARRLLLLGVGGALVGLAVDGWTIASAARLGGVQGVGELAGDLLVAGWFLGGGLILLGAGRQLARVGWTAILGGAGQILTAISAAVGFGGTPGITGTAVIDWFLLIGLFVVIYLVRIWSFVVRGRLPGPGVV